MNRVIRIWTGVLLLAILFAGSPAARKGLAAGKSGPAFTLFESGPVRPLALSSDGRHLYAVNTPDNRLEIFRVTAGGLRHEGSVPVGLEPVAVAARIERRGLGRQSPVRQHQHRRRAQSARSRRVERTLLVGDEPRDIVFGGPERRSRVYHHRPPRPEQPDRSAAHHARRWTRGRLGVRRGQPRRLARRHAAHYHHAVRGHAARACSVSPDGATVYAAAFHSGNQTTTVFEEVVPDGGEPTGGLPSTRRRCGRRAPARDWSDREIQRHPLGRRARPQSGTTRSALLFPTRTCS